MSYRLRGCHVRGATVFSMWTRMASKIAKHMIWSGIEMTCGEGAR
jgi:hypothetical protein